MRASSAAPTREGIRRRDDRLRQQRRIEGETSSDRQNGGRAQDWVTGGRGKKWLQATDRWARPG
jgi:hypothetical protein